MVGPLEGPRGRKSISTTRVIAKLRHRPRKASPKKGVAQERASQGGFGPRQFRTVTKKGGFKAISSSAHRGKNLTREVPTSPLGNPGIDTTRERATTREEPYAWYKSKVDAPPRVSA